MPRADRSQPDADERRPAFTPVDADAERAVAAALLSSPVTALEACEDLYPDDFAVPAAREILTAARSLDAQGRGVDVVTVADELRRSRTLTRVGGQDGLAALLAAAGDVGNVETHAAIVADRALLRRVLDAGRSICGAAASPETSGPEALSAAEERVLGLAGPRSTSTLTPMSKAVADAMRELAQVRSQLLLGHPTSLDELDRLTAGFQAGQLITIAGRPGMGKSSLMLQMARHIAEATGLSVPFLSYEMSTSEITMRLLASTCSYDLHLLRQGEFRNVEGLDRTIAHAAQRLAGIPLLLDDTPPETVSGVRAAMRRLSRRTPVAAIFVDYLQLLGGDSRRGGDNRAAEVGEVSRGLKRMAADLGVPVVCGSQLNRNLEQRVGAGRRPQLSDLRESGSIEQDSSIVLMLHREQAEPGAPADDLVEVLVAKQRNGPAGPGVSVPVEFDAKTGRWSSTDRRPAPAAPRGAGGDRPYGTRPF